MISRLNRRHKARHPRPGGGKEGKNVGHLLKGVTDDSTVNVEASESEKKNELLNARSGRGLEQEEEKHVSIIWTGKN